MGNYCKNEQQLDMPDYYQVQNIFTEDQDPLLARSFEFSKTIEKYFNDLKLTLRQINEMQNLSQKRRIMLNLSLKKFAEFSSQNLLKFNDLADDLKKFQSTQSPSQAQPQSLSQTQQSPHHSQQSNVILIKSIFSIFYNKFVNEEYFNKMSSMQNQTTEIEEQEIDSLMIFQYSLLKIIDVGYLKILELMFQTKKIEPPGLCLVIDVLKMIEGELKFSSLSDCTLIVYLSFLNIVHKNLERDTTIKDQFERDARNLFFDLFGGKSQKSFIPPKFISEPLNILTFEDGLNFFLFHNTKYVKDVCDILECIFEQKSDGIFFQAIRHMFGDLNANLEKQQQFSNEEISEEMKDFYALMIKNEIVYFATLPNGIQGRTTDQGIIFITSKLLQNQIILLYSQLKSKVWFIRDYQNLKEVYIDKMSQFTKFFIILVILHEFQNYLRRSKTGKRKNILQKTSPLKINYRMRVLKAQNSRVQYKSQQEFEALSEIKDETIEIDEGGSQLEYLLFCNKVSFAYDLQWEYLLNKANWAQESLQQFRDGWNQQIINSILKEVNKEPNAMMQLRDASQGNSPICMNVSITCGNQIFRH